MAPLASETELRRPLTDVEIREGVAVKTAEAAADVVYEAVYEAVKARMEASGGRLYGQAYPSIKGTGTLNLVYFLDWRGEVAPPDEHREKVIDNHAFRIEGVSGLTDPYTGIPMPYIPPSGAGESVDVDVTIPELPPNAFRKQTGQGIPVASNVNGKTVERKVKYQPKRAKA